MKKEKIENAIILVDEARTPLIISGGTKNTNSLYLQAQAFARTISDDILTWYITDQKELKKVIEVIQKRSKKAKESKNTAEIISWRYNLDLHQVRSWLSQTEWNDKQQDMNKIMEKVVTYLSELDLLSSQETEDWSKKLFV